MPSSPDLELILNEWWGGGLQGCSWANGIITLAANLIIGGNPLYQVSDFLEFYPKFGVEQEAILAIAVRAAGAGYTAGDNVTVLQPDAREGILGVAAVDGGGAVTGFTAVDPAGTGIGYQVATGLATTGGTGTGLTVDITSISPFSSVVPQVVVQAYINLANASLQYNRWQSTWRLAMGLYVAHFLTLYLQSEGSVGTTAQQIAASGLERGIKIAEAAGDVSKSSQLLEGMEEWGAFAKTSYGTQLVTFARGIAPHSMYIY